MTLRDNDFTKMNNDAIALSGVNGVQITGNQVRDMNVRGSQHHDMIQVHPASGSSSNITIRGNVLDSNDTNTQAIYMGSGVTHNNISIENNTITNGHKFGIKIAATVAGLDIKNNVVIQDPALKSGKGGHTPEIDVSRSSSGVTITGNTAHEINASGNISGNKMVGIGTNAVASGTNTNWNSNSDTDTDSGWNSGGATVLDGDTVRGWTKKVINGFDWDDGDELKFQDYDKGTFKHKAGGNHLEVAGNGTSGTVDSAADLAELIDASSDITATKNGSTLVLRISQDDGTHAIRLNNMGDIDYNAGAAASGSGSSSNSGSSVVLDGDTVRGWTKKVINGFDWDDGDELRFQDYDKGTFKHKAGGNYLDVARNGQSGTVDSAADLKELIDSSSDIRATKNGDTLVLRISQDDGTHAIRLNNMDDIDFFL